MYQHAFICYLFSNFSSNYVFFSFKKHSILLKELLVIYHSQLLFFPFILQFTAIWLSLFPLPAFASHTSVKMPPKNYRLPFPSVFNC